MDVERLINTIKLDEGFSPIAYFDNDQWSYGFGCKAPHGGAMISLHDAEALLADRVQLAIRDFEDIYADCREKINDIRAEALCSMAFNLGKTKLLKFRKMNAAIRRNDWIEAAHQAVASDWYGQVGDRAKRIVQELATGEKEG
jgi:lysozyme